MTTFTRDFDTPVFKGKVDFPTGVYINGKFTSGSDNTTIKYVHLSLLSLTPNIDLFSWHSIIDPSQSFH